MGVAVFQQNILMMLNSEFHLIFTCPKVIVFLIFFNHFPQHRAVFVPVDLPKCLCPKGHRGVKNVTRILDKFLLQDMALKMKSK